MAILLIVWVLITLVFCLAFLGAAARRAPLMYEQMESESELRPGREPGVALQNARLPSSPSEGAPAVFAPDCLASVSSSNPR